MVRVPCPRMLPLPDTIERGRAPYVYTYRKLRRTGDVALYEQTGGEASGPSYEVFVVQKRRESVLGGRTIAAHEAMPSAEQWGRWGWTLRTLADAEAKFAALVTERANTPDPGVGGSFDPPIGSKKIQLPESIDEGSGT